MGKEVRIGCSGWQYRHWRGAFYPGDVPMTRWLEAYAGVFDTVELNNSFYRLPDPDTFLAWRRRTPRGFCFAVKASRYLTHIRKLKDPANPLERLLEAARGLGPRLGPLLYQLPPGWHRDEDRLGAFLEVLPTGYRHVLEFRHATWYSDRVLALLDRPHLTVCLHDMPGSVIGPLRLGGFVYARFHGAGARYGGGYPESSLARWAEWIAAERDAGRPAFLYFNNDIGGHAPRDALTLRRLVNP